jgi:hypothetical protein
MIFRPQDKANWLMALGVAVVVAGVVYLAFFL